MSEIYMWLFLVVAAVLAIVIGRLGTMLKDRIEQRQTSKLNKLS